MKTKESKNDPIAEKIVKAIAYIKNNPLVILSVLIGLIVFVFFVSNKLKNDERKEVEAKLASDRVMLELVNNGLNDPDFFNSFLKEKVENLNRLYPKSEHVSYMSFILSNKDSIDFFNFISSIKNNISNDWFRAQAHLISGDYHSNMSDLKSALSDYKLALKYSTSNERKAYSNYKIGNIYFINKDFISALSFYESAEELIKMIISSNQNGAISRNLQFSSWSDRNSIALSKVKSLLKK
jgi:tetratricopeptide (TPR) repeat protein